MPFYAPEHDAETGTATATSPEGSETPVPSPPPVAPPGQGLDHRSGLDAAVAAPVPVQAEASPAPAFLAPEHDQPTGNDSNTFQAPLDDRKARIDQLAQGDTDPTQLFVNGQSDDLDAVAQAVQARNQAWKDKNALEKTVDVTKNTVGGAIGLAKGIGEEAGKLGDQIHGASEALGDIGDLMRGGKGADEITARAQAALEHQAITPDQFKSITDTASKLADMDRQQTEGTLSPEDYTKQRAALVGPEATQLDAQQQRAARETVAGVKSAWDQSIDSLRGNARWFSPQSAVLNGAAAIGQALFEGPIPVKDQQALLAQGIPVTSAKNSKDMTLEELKSNLQAQRLEAQQKASVLQGNVGPMGEAAISALNGGQAPMTADQQNAGAFPVRPEAVEGANTLAMLITSALPVPGAEESSAILGGLGMKAAAAPLKGAGWASERAADLAFKAGKKYLGLGALGLLNHTEQIPHVLEGLAWASGGKTLGMAGQHLANILDAGGSDLLRQGSGTLINGEALVPRQGFGAQLFTRNAQNLAKGVGQGLVFGLPTAQDPEQLGQSIGQMGALELATRMPGSTLQATRSSLFDSAFLRPGADPKTPTPAFDVGTNADLDAAHNASMEKLDPALKEQVNGMRALTKGKAEVYVLPDAEFEQQARAGAIANGLDPGKVNAAGVTMATGSGGTPQAFIRHTKVKDALYHETGHALWPFLDPASKQAFTDAYLATKNPDTLVRNYVKEFTGVDHGVGFNDLPTEQQVSDGAPPGPAGLTRERALEEMGADNFDSIFKGQSVTQLSKDPTVRRQMQFALGTVLERMGIPTVTSEAAGILGTKPAWVPTVLLDQFLRNGLAQSSLVPPVPLRPRPSSTIKGEAPVPDMVFGPQGPRPSMPPPLPGAMPVTPKTEPIYTKTGPSMTQPPPTGAAPAQATPRQATPPTPGVVPIPGAMPGSPPPLTPELAQARAEAVRGLKGLGFNVADAKAKVAASTGRTTEEILQDVLIKKGRSSGVVPPPSAPPTSAAAPAPPNPAEQRYRESLEAVGKRSESPQSSGATPTVDNTATVPDVAPRTPEAGAQEPATAQSAAQTATPKVDTGDVQKAWNQMHPEFPATDVSVDAEGNYHVRHPGGDEDILAPTQLADLGIKGRNAPAKGAIQGATSARMVDATTAEAHTTWFGLNADGSNDTGDVDAHGRNLRGYFGDETHNREVVGASLPWRTLAGTVGDFTRDPRLMESIRKGDYKVRVTTADGKSVDAKIVDVGPAEWTRNGLDITYGTGKALGLTDNATTHFQILGPDGKPLELKSAPRDWVPKGGQGAPGESTGPAEGLPPRERNRRMDSAPGLEDAPQGERQTPQTPKVETPEAPPETPGQRVVTPEASPEGRGMPEQTPGNKGFQAQQDAFAQDQARMKALQSGLDPYDVQRIAQQARDVVSTQTSKGKERTGQALAKEQEKAANLAVLEAHAKQLDPADDRVRLITDPDTGRQVVSGARLLTNDFVHQHLLQGVPKVSLDHAAQWTKAIDQGKAVTLTYRSAGSSEHSPVGEVRQAEYAADPAAARARGESAGTEATKQVIPLSVRVTGLDSPHRVVHLQALSPDKLLQNFQHIRTALDVTHPAYNMLPGDFAHEVSNYIENHRAGYRGDGTAPLAGTDEVPVKVDPTYQPKLLGQTTAGEAAQGMPSMRQQVEKSKKIGEVINASMHNLTAQGKGPKAEHAQGLAKANQGYLGEGGETNPLRERLGKLWTEHVLSSPFEDIRADNVVKFHGTREKGPKAIRSQSESVSKALEKHGLPNKKYVAAGFMPMAEQRPHVIAPSLHFHFHAPLMPHSRSDKKKAER